MSGSARGRPGRGPHPRTARRLALAPWTSWPTFASLLGRAWPVRPAIDLTEDTGILTPVGNEVGSEVGIDVGIDVGIERIFARQVSAHGRPGAAASALSPDGAA